MADPQIPQQAAEPQMNNPENKPGAEAPDKAKADALAKKAPESPPAKERQEARKKSAEETIKQIDDITK